MVVLSKIYTRTGDDGTTALGSGRRVAKYDLRVEAYGTLDETNAAIGIARLYTHGSNQVLDAMLARIFLGEADRAPGGHPLYEAVVLKAREMHLAGATVLQGTMSFGANSRLHTTKVLRLSEDLPTIIEIVDSTEKIDAFIPFLDEVIQEGLVTRERANVIFYRHGSPPGE